EFIEAKLSFEDETGISAKELPDICPYTFGQIMDRGFRPE
ncbi:MAG: DUF29 family protein, partial [Nitrospirae bacterium]|nr:DUF29 family protein [Nitrospirota bacterium]